MTIITMSSSAVYINAGKMMSVCISSSCDTGEACDVLYAIEMVERYASAGLSGDDAS